MIVSGVEHGFIENDYGIELPNKFMFLLELPEHNEITNSYDNAVTNGASEKKATTDMTR
jgi:hypothetical protein